MSEVTAYEFGPDSPQFQILKPKPCLQFVCGGDHLFTIHENGRIERGPGFTTNDEMSLKFWECVEKSAKGFFQR